MSKELKPCPFCGASARMHKVARDWWRIVAHHEDNCIMDDCHAPSAPQTPEQRELLIAAWNRRAELESAQSSQQGAVAHFLNSAAAGEPPHYEQVADEFIGSPGTFPLYTHPHATDSARIRREALEEAAQRVMKVLGYPPREYYAEAIRALSQMQEPGGEG